MRERRSGSASAGQRASRFRRRWQPPLLLLLLAAAAVPSTRAYTVHLSSAHQHRIAQHAARLPVDTDVLSEMTDGERRALGNDLKLTIGETLAAMDHPQATIPLEVRLVGFDGSG